MIFRVSPNWLKRHLWLRKIHFWHFWLLWKDSVVGCPWMLLFTLSFDLTFVRSRVGAVVRPLASRTRRHMWAEFVVGSLLCTERFFSRYSGFPLFSKTNIFKSLFDLDVRHLIMSLWLGWLRKHSLCLTLNLHIWLFFWATLALHAFTDARFYKRSKWYRPSENCGKSDRPS